MELKFLAIFCKVVELKSFSKAAAALFLTQPTISSHIKSLEDEVGIRLLDRLGRDVLPTRAGEILYRYAKEIIKLQENAVQAIEQFKGNVKGRLVIGGSTIPGEYILPEYIGRFKKAHPDITIALRIGDTQNIMDMLMEGAVEAGVVGSRIDDKRIDCVEFLEDELLLVASGKHFTDIKKRISRDDLKKFPVIIREEGSGSRKALAESLKQNEISLDDLDIIAEMGSTEAVKQAVKAGMGVAFLSRFAVKDDIPCKTLREIQIKDFGVKRHFYIVADRTREVSPICLSFIQEILPASFKKV